MFGLFDDYRFVFGAALLASVALTPAARGVARRYGFVAQPKADRWHRKPTALLGGVAVVAATLLAAWAAGIGGSMMPVMLGATALFVVGFIDDIVGLRPATKLAAQIAAAGLVVSQGGGIEWSTSATAAAIISIFWFVAITNAFNLLDNMDGLCAGIGLIAAVGLAIATPDTGGPGVLLCAALAGALLGFLIFNFNPASIFLGDSGSLFIGFLLAGLAAGPTEGNQGGTLSSVIVVPVLLLAIPIVDTTLVTIARKLSGRAASQGGTDHLSHRLVALGFPERMAVLLLYGLAAAAGGTAALTGRFGIGSVGPLIALLVIGLVLVGVALARVRVYADADFALLQNQRYTPLLTELTYKRRVFEVLLDFLLISAAYYGAYRLRFEGREFGEAFPVFINTLPLAIAVKISVYWFAGVYRGVWRYAGLADLSAFLKGSVLGSGLFFLVAWATARVPLVSFTVFLIDAMLALILLVGSRLSFRALAEVARRHRRAGGSPVLIYGAGEGGLVLLRELLSNRTHGYRPIGFLDDDPRMHGRKIHGYYVLGGIEALEEVLGDREIKTVIVAAQQLRPDVERQLVATCAASGIGLIRSRFALEHHVRVAVDAADPAPVASTHGS